MGKKVNEEFVKNLFDLFQYNSQDKLVLSHEELYKLILAVKKLYSKEKTRLINMYPSSFGYGYRYPIGYGYIPPPGYGRYGFGTGYGYGYGYGYGFGYGPYGAYNPYSSGSSFMGTERNADLTKLDYPNQNVLFIGMDTRPTVASYGYLKMLNHFKYNHIILGSPPGKEQPEGNNLFFNLFWRYRFDRYFETLDKIVKGDFAPYGPYGPNTIVVITDMNDVSVHDDPDELENIFNNFPGGAVDVLFSGTAYCCNIDRVKEFAKLIKVSYDDLLDSLKNEPDNVSFLQNMWGYHSSKGIPALQGFSDAQRIITEFKGAPSKVPGTSTDSAYKYINAGTIMGKAGSLLKLFNQIKNDGELYTQTLDDEGNLHLWYIKNKGKADTDPDKIKVAIDYGQNVFAIPDELENRDGERQLLGTTGESRFFSYEYDSLEKKYKNKYNIFPIFFHYPAYRQSGLKPLRSIFVSKLNEIENIFTPASDSKDKEFMEEIQKCGSTPESQTDKTLCEDYLGCKFDSDPSADIKCKFPDKDPKRRDDWNERYQRDWLKKYRASMASTAPPPPPSTGTGSSGPGSSSTTGSIALP